MEDGLIGLGAGAGAADGRAPPYAGISIGIELDMPELGSRGCAPEGRATGWCVGAEGSWLPGRAPTPPEAVEPESGRSPEFEYWPPP